MTSNRYQVITGCAPSSTCLVCQEGRKRYRDTVRTADGKKVTFRHLSVTGRLVECEDQKGPEADLTQRF